MKHSPSMCCKQCPHVLHSCTPVCFHTLAVTDQVQVCHLCKRSCVPNFGMRCACACMRFAHDTKISLLTQRCLSFIRYTCLLPLGSGTYSPECSCLGSRHTKCSALFICFRLALPVLCLNVWNVLCLCMHMPCS